MTNFKKTLGQKIQKIRKEKGFTQEKLAELISIEVPSLSNIETGKFAPSFDTMQKLSKALDVEISEFYRLNLIEPDQMIKEMSEKMSKNKKLAVLTYNFFKTIEHEL
jgi:transcriptional regulator with XRE-family HTH domain